MIHSTVFIDENVTIGRNTDIWHFCHVMEGSVIGDFCGLGQNVFIGKNVRIGDNCKIQNNVSVYEGVSIDDNVFLGPSVVFTNVLNPRSDVCRNGDFLCTIVKEGSTIGANSTIVCGNVLGERCFVAAGSVITKDVSPYTLVSGNPAKVVGEVCRCGEVLRNGICHRCSRRQK